MLRILLFNVLLAFILPAGAQILSTKLALRLGVSTSDFTTEEIKISNLGKDLGLQLEDAGYSLHAGAALQVEIANFVLQPEVLYVSVRSDFRLRDLGKIDTVGRLYRESYNMLDIPFMLGYRFGPLRLQAGPVGHLYLGGKSGLRDAIEQYEMQHEKLKLGYQAGLGLDFWRLLLDFKYQGSFQHAGDHITVAGQQYHFDKYPGRFVITAGLTL